MISITADKMLAEGLILRESAAAPQAIVRISKPGIDKLRDADIVLARTYEEYFAPLSANLKAVLSTGSMATNTSTGEGNRMREGHFFSAFEILHAFLIVETFLTNATHSSGLALTGFRMLYVLHEEGRPLSPSEIRRKLILKPSTTTYEIDRLLAGGYVQRTGNSLDRRSVLIALTDDGAAVFACAFPLVEAVFTSDIRPSGRTERDAYKDIAASIVASLKA